VRREELGKTKLDSIYKFRRHAALTVLFEHVLLSFVQEVRLYETSRGGFNNKHALAEVAGARGWKVDFEGPVIARKVTGLLDAK
jgi:hypothetical protein